MSLDSFPTTNFSGPKAVIVEGGNIQINTDIKYGYDDLNVRDTTSNVLLLIARKNTNGTGGNISINPSVTRIDAIIIADGAIINADSSGVKNWINDTSLLGNRLRLNGRLYSFNTRG